VTATKSWGPTLTETVGREVDYQVAAPTETRTPTLHRANIAHKECGWKDGDRGGLAEWELTLRKKKVKVCLTSTGLLMEGLEFDNWETLPPRIISKHLPVTYPDVPI
jgi:hypothetical protein